MKIKLTLLVSTLVFINLVHAQKLLHSTMSECISTFRARPDYVKDDITFVGSSSKLFVTLSNGDRYTLTFAYKINEKLYGIELIRKTPEATRQKFNEEIAKRSAERSSSGGYFYYDEKGRKIYVVLQEDDFGTTKIIWEAAFPFQWD